MVKTVPAALTTHKAQDVTAFATAWQIERLDGVIQRFANGSRDVFLDIGDGNGSQFYSSKEGFSRTNIANDSELSIGNLEVIGIFSGASLDETDLRRGIYDFADVKIMTYNQLGPTDGIIKMLRGQMAQVVVTTKGFFKVELRDLTQLFTKELGELYSKDCRADLGDKRCRVPIFPDYIPPSTALSLGEFYRIAVVAPDPTPCSTIVMNFEDTDGVTSGAPGFTNEGLEADPNGLVGQRQIDTAQAPAGGSSTSSLLLDGAGDRVEWTDRPAFAIETNLATIQAHVRLNVASINQCIAAQYRTQFNRRSWAIWIDTSNNLNLAVGTSTGTLDFQIIGTTVMTTGVDYHVAACKKTNGDWELWLDGASEGTATPTSQTMSSNPESLRIGALSAPGVTFHWNGWIDRFHFLIGASLYESPFTPPTGNLIVPAASDGSEFIWEEFGDKIYEVTTAGTTGPCPIAPNTTVGGTHDQGSVTFTALHSFMRFAEVSAVDGTEPRRKFTVTELTPNSGYSISARTPATLGYADGFFDFGGVTFDTGSNATRAKEVRIFTADDGVTITQDIELWESMPFDITVGDKLRIFPGCDKLHATCFTKYNNANNIVAEPFVPGADTLGTYPDAH